MMIKLRGGARKFPTGGLTLPIGGLNARISEKNISTFLRRLACSDGGI